MKFAVAALWFLASVAIVFFVAFVKCAIRNRGMGDAMERAGLRSSFKLVPGEPALERTFRGRIDGGLLADRLEKEFEAEPAFESEGRDGKWTFSRTSNRNIGGRERETKRFSKLEVQIAGGDTATTTGETLLRFNFGGLAKIYGLRLVAMFAFSAVLAWLPLKPNMGVLADHRWFFFLCMCVAFILALLALMAEQIHQTDHYFKELVVGHLHGR